MPAIFWVHDVRFLEFLEAIIDRHLDFGVTLPANILIFVGLCKKCSFYQLIRTECLFILKNDDNFRLIHQTKLILNEDLWLSWQANSEWNVFLSQVKIKILFFCNILAILEHNFVKVNQKFPKYISGSWPLVFGEEKVSGAAFYHPFLIIIKF